MNYKSCIKKEIISVENDDNVNECCWTLSGCETNNIIVNVMHYTCAYSLARVTTCIVHHINYDIVCFTTRKSPTTFIHIVIIFKRISILLSLKKTMLCEAF